jgi:hypothetical protein
LEAINETLKGCQLVGTEVELPPFRTGNPEASRNSRGEFPPEDTVEEYEIRFMELVKYVSYMDNDQ